MMTVRWFAWFKYINMTVEYFYSRHTKVRWTRIELIMHVRWFIFLLSQVVVRDFFPDIVLQDFSREKYLLKRDEFVMVNQGIY